MGRGINRIRQTDIRHSALVEGVPELDAVVGVTWIYIDQTTGDLTAKFGDGTKYILQSVTPKIKEIRIEATHSMLGASAPR